MIVRRLRDKKERAEPIKIENLVIDTIIPKCNVNVPREKLRRGDNANTEHKHINRLTIYLLLIDPLVSNLSDQV